MDNLEKAAIAAYEAYCETRDWKGFNGDRLPCWPDVSEPIKAGWRAAVIAAIEKLTKLCSEGPVEWF